MWNRENKLTETLEDKNTTNGTECEGNKQELTSKFRNVNQRTDCHLKVGDIGWIAQPKRSEHSDSARRNAQIQEPIYLDIHLKS